MAAELLLRGYSGAVSSIGKNVTQLANKDGPAVNMRSKICGKEAKRVCGRAQWRPIRWGSRASRAILTDKIEG